MNLKFSDHKVTNILLGFEGKDKSKYLWIMNARATKLGWADWATDGSDSKWVSRGWRQVGLTSVIKMGSQLARWRWACKLHGVTNSRRHSMGVGDGDVDVGEWVSLTLCLASLSSVSPLTLPFLSLFYFILFFSLVFLLSLFGVGLLTTKSWVFFFFF